MTENRETSSPVNLDSFRIAILSGENFTIPGGAQRVIMDQARALHATIICPDYDPAVVKTYDPAGEVRFSSLHVTLPKEPFRQLRGKMLFRRLSLDYDFFLCNDDMAMSYLVHKVPHLVYMHTPRRALYDMYHIFVTDLPLLKQIPYRLILPLVRMLDQRFVKKYVHAIACNSHNTRNRIWKYYQKDARVIYPSIHLSSYHQAPPEDFWLSVGRVDKWKRIRLQVEAFSRMPDKQLLVAGPVYPVCRSIVKNTPSNIRFLGSVSEEHLCDLYARCRGFITTAIDEDFGITPIEAMASGKPVVATKEGGYLETVIDGYTGILVGPDTGEICRAVEEIDTDPQRFSDACISRARKFDYERFSSEMQEMVREIVAEYLHK
ncbi:MAG: glycosyltransferase [Methanospirillaceae archaeon]|nr:glycosyltransferase [Methanospirillaceae archaeon]